MTAVQIFKGLRYATASRFSAPEPYDGPLEDLDTGMYGAQCLQVVGMMEQLLGQGRLPSAEDCHFLNVFTPARDGRRRPVLFWVHGGAFTNGTGATPWYHGASLARRYDVVVVTINYRIGAFGFTHLADHGGRDFVDSGNVGVLDQVEALRWTQRHIAEFGGDPDNVTIFGESAGGASVLSLMATPRSEGLFQRAIALSPSMLQLRTRDRAHDSAARLLAAAGVGPDDLRTIDAERLLEAQKHVLRDRAGAFTAFSPTPGEPSIPTAVEEAAARNPVPLVIGTTKDEMLLFTAFDPTVAGIDEAELARRASLRFGEATPAALAAYRRHRPDSTPGAIASAISTDEGFRVPARRLAEARAAHGLSTWMHWFTWETPAFDGVLKACHALDVPFVFHNLDRNGVAALTGDAPERERIADVFSRAVAGFAGSGDPGWAPYDTVRRTTMRIDVESGPVDDPEPDLRLLWDTSTGQERRS